MVIDQRKLLLDAIKTPSNMMLCIKLEKLGYIRFTGNQHNPAWSWVRSKLEELDTNDLERVYLGDMEWLL